MIEAVRCRSCAGAGLRTILSLGITPLANALLTRDQLAGTEEKFPLELAFCPTCSLVQITETVSPERLFRDYPYFTSFSDTALKNAAEIVTRQVDEMGLGAGSLAVEIASNDGYLLQYYLNRGVPVLGIEPARNVARVARERGIQTIEEFFTASLAADLCAQGFSADVIHANNVLAHVPDLNGLVEGLKLLLKPAGRAVIEVPYVRDLIERVEFDTIYHEHLCYFSLTALEHLFRAHGLLIVDVEHLPIHGGTLRVFAGHASDTTARVSARKTEMLGEEHRRGIDQFEFYADLGARVDVLRGALLTLLTDLKAQGKRIAGYGASAKGSTLLNYFRIGTEIIDFVADRSTVKQGLYTPGAHLPILPPEKLVELRPDYVLLLTWNFADEIIGQQKEYLEQGGRFIIPIPEIRIYPQ